VSITVGGLDFDDAFADFQDRDIERATAEVIHSDGLVLALVEPVGQCGRRGLVDDALHLKTSNLAGVFRGLALGVIEVRRNRDNGFGHLLAEVVFRRLLQLLKNHRGDLRRGVLLPLRDDRYMVAIPLDLVRHHFHFFADFVEPAPHEPLDRVDRVLGVGDGLPFRDLPD